jgi:Flp pilus assembly protein TadD
MQFGAVNHSGMANKTASTPIQNNPSSGWEKFIPWLLHPIWSGVASILLAFVLYGNTIGHEYALDDAIVITQNGYTLKGADGLGEIFGSDAFEGFFKTKKDLVAGGRYRPLSIASFALEVELFGLNPHVSHFINVLLYGLLGWVLLLGLTELLKGRIASTPRWVWMPWTLTLLFMVHPIHTEVVANIKGRDEILAMLLSMLAFWRVLVWSRTGNVLELPLGLAAIFLAALSKETALPFVVLIPLALWWAGTQDFKKIGLATGVLAAGAGLYWVLRTSIVGGFTAVKSTEILNDPFLGASYLEQVATAAKTVVIYLGKMVFPFVLSHDYYFNQVPVIGLGDPMALLGMLFIVLAAVGGFYWVRKGNLAGYGLLFFLLSFSIVSNVVFPIGTTMGERFLFVPSLGLLMAGVSALDHVGQKALKTNPRFLLTFVIGLSAAYGIRTILRNPTWKNDFVLFTTDVANSPNSAKVQTAAGGALADEAIKPGNEGKRTQYLQQAIVHLQKAVEIYPQHGLGWMLKGNAHFNLKQYAEALTAFKQTIAYRPGMVDAYKNAALSATNIKSYNEAESFFNHYLNERPNDTLAWINRGDNFEAWGKADDALSAYGKALAVNPNSDIALGKMGMVFGKRFQNFDKSIELLQQALALNPKEKMHYENLGIAMAMKGQFQPALEVFTRGLQQFPNDPQLLRNMGITYGQMGDDASAQRYLNQVGTP